MSDNIDYAKREKGFEAPFAADEESPYIFISYAHEDRDRVFPIITRLYEQGWKIWYDEGIPPATNYTEVIARHIARCSLFLMFVTQTACERPFVIENEVEYAIRCKSREQIMLCFLEEDIVMPHGASMLLGDAKSPKYRKVVDSELESVLEGIEGLTRGKQRDAVPFRLDSGEKVLTSGGEYEFVKCDGGVRLTRYRGSDADVVVPTEYPAGSGQKVVELHETFEGNQTVRTVRLPATVRAIRYRTFCYCDTLTDVYIPSSVKECNGIFVFLGTRNNNCTLHCADGSASLAYAKKNGLPYVIDNSLAVFDEPTANAAQSVYAYISYSADMNQRVAEIIGTLEKHNCTVFDGSELSGTEAMRSVRECACFVALVSRGYLAGEDIEFLRTAQAMNKPKLIYVLEACELPSDLSIVNDSQQQLRYDALNEEQRTAKLVEWLQKHGCRRVSADIPGFEYTATTKGGITLTKYTGSGGNVVIEREYGGLPVTRIGNGAFEDCSSLTAITIPDGVTSIGDGAFRDCSSLTDITIPDSVTSIGDWAFGDCRNLTCINVGYNNTAYCDIDGVLFSKDKTRLIVCPGGHGNVYSIPEGVTSIGYRAFDGCRNLTGIAIPDGVVSIGYEAFQDCSNLTDITIPDGVTFIGIEAFYGCNSLTVYCSEGSYAWQYCENNDIRHEAIAIAEPVEATELATTTQDSPRVPRKTSPAKWLIPLLILLALGAAVGLQLSGLVDILGLLGL